MLQSHGETVMSWGVDLQVFFSEQKSLLYFSHTCFQLVQQIRSLFFWPFSSWALSWLWHIFPILKRDFSNAEEFVFTLRMIWFLWPLEYRQQITCQSRKSSKLAPLLSPKPSFRAAENHHHKFYEKDYLRQVLKNNTFPKKVIEKSLRHQKKGFTFISFICTNSLIVMSV